MTTPDPARPEGGERRRIKMPTDAQIRKAVAADIHQWTCQALTPTRGYSTPIDNVKALISATLRRTSPRPASDEGAG